MNKSGYVHRRYFDELLEYEISLESFHLCWKSEQLFEKILTKNSVKKSKVSDPVYEERGAYLRIPEKRVPRLTSSVDMLKNHSEGQSGYGCDEMVTEKNRRSEWAKTAVSDWFLRLIFSTSLEVKL